MIFVKRAYDPPVKSDGQRFLVDRLWPRGVKKEALKLESWMKEISPSEDLRKWFGHDSEKWEEFQTRYFAELDKKSGAWKPLVAVAREEDITLVFGSHDVEHNNAIALRWYLIGKLKVTRKAERSRLTAV